MQLRSRYIPSAGECKWTSLPPEIRLMILEQIEQTKITGQRTAPWCSVSSEWQAFFEKRNFRSLKLTTLPDIYRFRRLAGDRQRLVKTVWLHITLEKYHCLHCDKPEDAKTIATNNQRFSKRLLVLLTVLSEWDTTTRGGASLTLMLSASSSSDIEHHFAHFGADDKEHSQRARYSRFDLQGSKMRRIGGLLDFNTKVFTAKSRRQGQNRLPTTPVVSRFVMGEQSHRSLSAAALEKLLQSLTHLKHIRYRPWRGVDRNGQRLRVRSNIALLKNLPSAVGSLSLWEELSTRLHSGFRNPTDLTMGLASAAVKASQRLRSFSVSSAVDAVDFFQAAGTRAGANWPRLKTLALRSTKALWHTHGSVPANDLLSAAGKAAVNMPRLGTLEMWSWRVDDGFRFVYEVSERQTSLKIEASWNFKPSVDMLEIWKTVGVTHTRHELEVTLVTLSKEEVAHRSKFLRRLRLRRLIDDL